MSADAMPGNKHGRPFRKKILISRTDGGFSAPPGGIDVPVSGPPSEGSITAMTVIAGQRAPASRSPPGSGSVLREAVTQDAHGEPRPAAVPVISIRLLGRFSVHRDGQEIAPRAFGGRLARRLLRLLALRRGTLVPKDLIADTLLGRERAPLGTQRQPGRLPGRRTAGHLQVRRG